MADAPTPEMLAEFRKAAKEASEEIARSHDEYLTLVFMKAVDLERERQREHQNGTKEIAMPLPQLLRNLSKREQALADLEVVRKEVFGDLGDAPSVYSDYDRLTELSGMMRRAIETLRTT